MIRSTPKKSSNLGRPSDDAQHIASTLVSHTIQLGEHNMNTITRTRLPNPYWENGEQVISNLAYCYARSSKKGVSAKTEKYNADNETCIRDEREKFGKTQSQALTDFFDCFARAFVVQFHKSITEPDVEGMDDDVVAGILASKHPLPNETAECVYYISGFILQAIRTKGIRRKTGKSSGYYRFASAKTLDAAGVLKAKAGSLPTRRTDETPNSGLPYPGSDFYEATVRIEQVYQALMTTENLLLFGPDAVSRIRSKLLGCDDIRKQFSIGKKSYPKVVDHIVHTFMHLRGEDFLTRMVAKTEKRLTVANPVANYIKSEPKPATEDAAVDEMETEKIAEESEPEPEAAVEEVTEDSAVDEIKTEKIDENKPEPEAAVEEVTEDTAVDEFETEETAEVCSEPKPEEALATMELSWTAELPTETVFTQLEDAMNLSAVDNDPVASTAAVKTGFAKLEQSGLFTSCD
jgi:hypothetical protein